MFPEKNPYPLLAYNYKVSVGSQTLSFSEVSGLSVSYEKVVYKDGLSYRTGPAIVRAQKNLPTVVLKRGVSANRRELFTWLQENVSRDVLVDLCDEAGVPVVRWVLIQALPLKLDAPSFSAAGNEVAIEQLELIVRDLKMEYLN
jgi:phage tail-like protein